MNTRFSRFVWSVFAYNLAVVLWGGYVRASGSGAGCGSHWPMCNGEVIPTAPTLKTWVELSHRVTSGIALMLVVVMTVLAFRTFPKGSSVRTYAGATLALMVSEALVGAGLVLFELVAHDASLKRALSMAIHMSNTFFLLAFMASTAVAASGASLHIRAAFRKSSTLLPILLVLATGVTGAIAALGDTLFPATSLREGLQQDMSETAHWLLRARSLHPALAVIAAAVTLLSATRTLSNAENDSLAKHASVATFGLVILQVLVGATNLILLAPTALQLVHLVLADLVFVAVFMGAASQAAHASEQTLASTAGTKIP